jgi:hypothetical protein
MSEVQYVSHSSPISKNEVNAVYGAYGGREEMYTEFWWGNPNRRDYMEDPPLHGKIILKEILKKSVERACIGLILSRLNFIGSQICFL